MLINNAYAETDTMIAQDSGASQAAPPPVESGWTSFVPMIAIFAVFYFFLIRPQEKRRKMQESLVAGVKKGEEVLTTSGIYGTVTKIDDSNNMVYLEIASNVEIKILKTSIVDIVSRNKAVDSSGAAQPETKAKAKGKKSAK